MDAKAKVLEALKGAAAPMKVGEIVTATGLDKKEVDSAIKALKKEEAITSPVRCQYSIA